MPRSEAIWASKSSSSSVAAGSSSRPKKSLGELVGLGRDRAQVGDVVLEAALLAGVEAALDAQQEQDDDQHADRRRAIRRRAMIWRWRPRPAASARARPGPAGCSRPRRGKPRYQAAEVGFRRPEYEPCASQDRTIRAGQERRLDRRTDAGRGRRAGHGSLSRARADRLRAAWAPSTGPSTSGSSARSRSRRSTALDPDRVLREAQAAARLNHPAIVTLYEFGEGDRRALLVSELVAGRHARATWAPSAGSATATLPRSAPTSATALAHAHERGVVHRDVKPAERDRPRRARGRAARQAHGLRDRAPRRTRRR